MLAQYSPGTGDADEKRDRLHQAYYITGQSEAASMLINPLSSQLENGFEPQLLVQQLDAALDDVSVSESTVLDTYDDYY